MFGYSKEIFEGFITEIKNDWASVTVVDSQSKKSYMSVPVEDLKKDNIERKAGTIFLITLKSWFRWERLVFSPIKQKHMSKEEFDALYKYYEEEYGDV